MVVSQISGNRRPQVPVKTREWKNYLVVEESGLADYHITHCKAKNVDPEVMSQSEVMLCLGFFFLNKKRKIGGKTCLLPPRAHHPLALLPHPVSGIAKASATSGVKDFVASLLHSKTIFKGYI